METYLYIGKLSSYIYAFYRITDRNGKELSQELKDINDCKLIEILLKKELIFEYEAIIIYSPCDIITEFGRNTLRCIMITSHPHTLKPINCAENQSMMMDLIISSYTSLFNIMLIHISHTEVRKYSIEYITDELLQKCPGTVTTEFRNILTNMYTKILLAPVCYKRTSISLQEI